VQNGHKAFQETSKKEVAEPLRFLAVEAAQVTARSDPEWDGQSPRLALFFECML
jgi:hypothetical protein